MKKFPLLLLLSLLPIIIHTSQHRRRRTALITLMSRPIQFHNRTETVSKLSQMSCLGLENGYHYYDNFRKFRVCENETSQFAVQCGAGTVFDPLSRKCREGVLKEESAFCKELTPAFYDTETGDGIVYCEEDISLHFECQRSEKLSSDLRCHPRPKATAEEATEELAQICSFQEPGTYADLRDGCQTFYVCRHDAQPLRGTCVPGRIFVEDYHRCLSASEFPCQTSKVLSKGEIIHEPCDNGTEGFVPTQGCHGYMICKTGLPTERHWCVPGYLFDSDKKLCQPAADVECSESGRPTPKPTPTTSTTESPSNFKCNTAVKGSQCKKYYRCKDDDVEVVECPGGQVFHPRISRCVPGMSLVCLMDKSSRSSAESKAEVSQSHSTTPPPLLTTPPHPVFKPPPNYPRFTWADLHPFFQVHSSPPRRDQLDLNYQLNRKPFAYPPNPTSSLGNPALQLVSFNRRYFHRLPDPGSNQV